MQNEKQRFRRRVAGSILFLVALFGMLGAVSTVQVYAQEPAAEERAMTETEAGVAKFGFIAAAVAFGFGALGAGIGIANVGAAAMGAISEKPEVAGQALIFIALAEGLVVFGFITALIILGRV
ncbi:MAG: ATPase [Spirochaetes bacterium]|jgi:V/A-type H+-transporting ATPase subunit K|nr:ATPase [Spirochaetota bacterium]